jgi:hypothetical protein
VSARWRAIAHSQIKSIIRLDQYAFSMFLNDIANVLGLAGWSLRRLREQNFPDKLHIRLEVIVNMVHRLRAAVGEDVISRHLKTYTVFPNTKFDPHTMDDGFPMDRRSTVSERGCVAGTTDIGLQMEVKGSSPLVLSKPKVALCSALID